MDAPLPEWNRGFQLLAAMGWRRHTGLGRRGQGRVDPVRIQEQLCTTGLGKESEYEEKAGEATESRRAMTAELIAFEDEAGREAREARAASEDAIRDAIRRENAAFYCEVCDKQYAKVRGAPRGRPPWHAVAPFVPRCGHTRSC